MGEKLKEKRLQEVRFQSKEKFIEYCTTKLSNREVVSQQPYKAYST